MPLCDLTINIFLLISFPAKHPSRISFSLVSVPSTLCSCLGWIALQVCEVWCVDPEINKWCRVEVPVQCGACEQDSSESDQWHKDPDFIVQRSTVTPEEIQIVTLVNWLPFNWLKVWKTKISLYFLICWLSVIYLCWLASVKDILFLWALLRPGNVSKQCSFQHSLDDFSLIRISHQYDSMAK